MTEQPPPEYPPTQAGEAPVGAQPTAASSGVNYPSAGPSQSLTARAEVKIAATFVGGLLAATILKRLGR